MEDSVRAHVAEKQTSHNEAAAEHEVGYLTNVDLWIVPCRSSLLQDPTPAQWKQIYLTVKAIDRILQAAQKGGSSGAKNDKKASEMLRLAASNRMRYICQ